MKVKEMPKIKTSEEYNSVCNDFRSLNDSAQEYLTGEEKELMEHLADLLYEYECYHNIGETPTWELN